MNYKLTRKDLPEGAEWMTVNGAMRSRGENTVSVERLYLAKGGDGWLCADSAPVGDAQLKGTARDREGAIENFLSALMEATYGPEGDSEAQEADSDPQEKSATKSVEREESVPESAEVESETIPETPDDKATEVDPAVVAYATGMIRDGWRQASAQYNSAAMREIPAADALARIDDLVAKVRQAADESGHGTVSALADDVVILMRRHASLLMGERSAMHSKIANKVRRRANRCIRALSAA